MKNIPFSQFIFFAWSAVASHCWAQYIEPNVLGLPAVPQPKPGQSAPVKPALSAAKAAVPVPARKQVSFGELNIEHGVSDGAGRVIFTSKTIYTTMGQKSDQLDGARAVQQYIAQSCGKQCVPMPMEAPKILPTGQLRFAVAFKPLHEHLQQAQFAAILQGAPMNLSPSQIQARQVKPNAAVSASAGQVQIAPVAASAPSAAASAAEPVK